MLGLVRRGAGLTPLVTRPPLLFKIIVATVLRADLQPFSEDSRSLAGFVHLHEPATEGTSEGEEESEGPIAKMKGVVWGMLYDGDICIIPPLPLGSVTIMTVTAQVSKEFGLTVSGDKH